MDKPYSVLDRVNSPEDLRGLSPLMLEQLCREIRSFLVSSVSQTGGHLSSNLGTVELTVALHRAFRSPVDQIVWDVGHQSYTHKLLTGRRKRMNTLRKKNGISGFTKTTESVHDAFISGHSSTSLAVADGLAKAKRVKGEEGHVIAVIGDGAFTGGMTLEGLNNAARGNRNLIIILNDNHMSISKNVGSLSWYLARLRANRNYFKLKDITKSAIGSIPLVGDNLVEVVSSSKAQLKNVMYNSSFFEELGYVHMGPVDGHDLGMLHDVLERAKSLHRPVFIHVETRKGKGYYPAEQNPGAYHSVPPFDPQVGSESVPSQDSFSAVFGRHLTGMAEEDGRICAVTAAMKYGTGLNYFSRRFRHEGRFFDVGIAEQHGVTFSAALAAKGLVPVFAVYSSFLQRSYDQLIHDCSIESRHMVLAVDRAGLVGEDGETHQGLFDVAFLTSIPGVVLYSPATYQELRLCVDAAVKSEKGVVAVRYPRGCQPSLPQFYGEPVVDFWHHQSPDADVLVVTYGREITQVVQARKQLEEEGLSSSVLRLTKIWPLNPAAVQIAAGYKRVFFVEEGMKTGGIGEHLLLALHAAGFQGDYDALAVEGFVPQGTVPQQLEALGLDGNGIATRIKSQWAERKSS